MSKGKKLFNKKFLDFAIIILAIAMGKYLLWTNINIAIFSIFIWIILNPVSSLIPAIPAIFFLAATPIALVIFNNQERANRFAIYAYYFLAMAVMMGIYEMNQAKKEKTSRKEAEISGDA